MLKPTMKAELRSALFLALVLVLTAAEIKAQTSVTDGRTPLGMAAGAPAGSYSLSGFDNVNLFSGNLSVAIPMITIGGRGSAGYTMTLRPNENRFSWRIIHNIQRTCGQNGCTVTGHTYFPSINWWATMDTQPGYRPGFLSGRKSGEFPTQPGGCPNGTSVWSTTLTRLTFSTGDGTEYELRDQLRAGQPQPLPGGTCGGQAALRGKVWVTADGTALTFISDVDIYDHSSNPEKFYPSGYILFRDGTRYRIDNGSVSWIRDRNGNQITFSVGTITDSLKRTVTYSYGEPDVITMKGFSGAIRTMQVSHTTLSAALRPCRPDPGYQCFSIQTYNQLFPASDGSSSSQFNPTVVSTATLPDGRQYRFYYNSYAELARVDLPTGGIIEYDYAAGAGADSSGLTSAVVGLYTEKAIYRRVVERRVYADGLNLEGRTTYSNNTNPITVDHLKPTGELISREKHYFYGDPRTTFFLGSNSYGFWNDGREYKTQIFSNDGTTELRRVDNNWQQGCTVSPWSTQIANNPRLADITSTLEPASVNKVSKKVFNYDCYNNLTDTYEYDFGTGAPATNYTRRTHTDYLTINPVNGASYDTLNPSSSNPDINASYHLRNLPSQTSVYDATGEKQRTGFEYDNYAVDTNHNTLILRSNISSICTVIQSPTSCDNSNTTGYTKRGNVTATTNTVFVNGSSTGSISAFNQFDIAGNVVKLIDSRGYATTLLYDDVFGIPNDNARLNTPPVELAGAQTYAFPTVITNALGRSEYAKYDYYLGKPINGENANGIVAAGYFSDPLDRPTQVRRAVGTLFENQTTFQYQDSLRLITTKADRDTNNDNKLVSETAYDQMGRSIESRQYEDAINYIVTKTEYDALGRAYRVSNPFRPWQGESAVWTTQAFDALGRVVSVTSPDNAVVSTSYSGNSVTVTEQTGKRQKSVTDALGRLTDVWEDPQPENPTGLNYQTTYAYDVLDNIVKVTQGSQQRFFMYDSLKRLLRARNPEQGTHSSLNLSDQLTGNSTWSVGYQYDAAGNLTQKTDARDIGGVPMTTTYAYDALNRNTTVDYSDTASINPDVKRFYDGAQNGIGRFWYSYKGGDYSAGSNVEHTSIDSYDVLGRPLVQRQLFKLNGVWSQAYQTSCGYNRAGGITSQTYPSGRTVSYTYDLAARTASVSGYLGDSIQRIYSTSMQYSSYGGLSREQFGTNTPVYHKAFYNIRGQLFDTRLSSVNDTWDWNRGRLILYYSSNHIWGQSGTDNNGNVRFAETWIPPENAGLDQADTLWEDAYTYDALNRLSSVAEQKTSVAGGWGSWTQQFRQQYTYDRYGNRTIDAAQTWGTGINNKQFEPNLSNKNQLGVPSGQTGVMSYDAAGNLINDTYTGAGAREYDAENRMTRAWGGNNQWQEYTYNADGQRTRRKVNGQETWQIYSTYGELLAEYPANGAVNFPQKEYAYRNGQLLVTAEPTVWQGALNVIWTNTVGVSANGNSLTKTAPDNWANGGAASSQSINSGDGYVEITASETNSFRMVGLSNGDANQDYTDIDFAAYLSAANLCIYEAGVSRGCVSTFATGDVIRVAVESGVVKYKKNGAVVYTSSAAPTYPLRVDTAFWSNGSTINNAVISGTSTGGLRWLVTDHLGTPRMILDQTGSLTNLKRHDYLPFGEELLAPTGGRTAALGYAGGDSVRQQFIQKDRDPETGLDFLEARYFASVQGRFISVDPIMSSAKPLIPQSWNRYTYGINNPVKFIDPNGLDWYTKVGGDGHPIWFDQDPGAKYRKFNNTVYYAGAKWGYVSLDPNSKNWEYGFQTEDQARAYYINSMGACDSHCRAHNERELTWQNDKPFGGNDTAIDATWFGITFPVGGPVGGLARGAVTRTVWDSIVATQEVYEGTVIPRSFELTTEGGGRVWVSGNATEHLVEFVGGRAATLTPEATRLVSQIQLANLQGAINAAGRMGIKYGEMMNVGRWELVFAPPRQPGQLPAVIHALYK